MRKMCAHVIGTVIVSIALCVLIGAQSGPKGRTPILTNDDLGATAGGEVPAPSESETLRPASKTPEAVGGAIAWHRDLRQAFEVARAEDKIVVADVYTDWCGFCKKMDERIYSDPVIVALSRQQVFVKVNAEDGGQGQSFAEKMRVSGYPMTIILDGNGRVLNLKAGYIASPRAFGELVQESKARAR